MPTSLKSRAKPQKPSYFLFLFFLTDKSRVNFSRLNLFVLGGGGLMDFHTHRCLVFYIFP